MLRRSTKIVQRSFCQCQGYRFVLEAKATQERVKSNVYKIPLFGNALDCMEKGSFRLARDLMQKAKYREPSSFEQSQANLFIDETLIEIENQLGNHSEAEKLLDKLIEDARNTYRGPDQFFYLLPKYSKLMNLGLCHNLDRALSLGKSLLADSRLPLIYRQRFSFSYGVNIA